MNYTYDGDGNRLQKSNGKIYWYGAGTEILDESDGSGNISNEYAFFGGKRVAMDTVSGTGSGSISSTYYYAEDFLGSSRTMVQAGQTSPCFDADFLPFGREKDNVATCTQNDYKFEGKERDTETGNDDFGARYYSSNFGRWLSPDWSSIPEPVPYANLTNPQTLNLYAMVQDNPESFADLDGHVNTPQSANQTITCDVTDEVGCDYQQVGYLSEMERNPDYASYTPEQLAGRLNLLDLPGDPYALTFTPTVKVATCLKDVTACQQASQGVSTQCVNENCTEITQEVYVYDTDHHSVWQSIKSFFGGALGVGAASITRIRADWEAHFGKPWPKESNGTNYQAHHEQYRSEGGGDEPQNITPMTRQDHIDLHKGRGDFKRWGRWGSRGQNDAGEPVNSDGSVGGEDLDIDIDILP